MKPIVTRTWREQHDRMRRWQERIQQRRPTDQHLIDDCYAFFACCFHLRDWIAKDKAVPPDVKAKAWALFDKVSGDEWLCLCADLANGSKQMELNATRRFKEESRVEELRVNSLGASGLGVGRVGSVLMVRVGEKPYRIHEVINRSIEVWDTFLTRHGLLVP